MKAPWIIADFLTSGERSQETFSDIPSSETS